jgi:putative endonuclease
VPFVYLLRCRDGSLYAGATVELERRVVEHRAGQASRYTRSRLPVELVWSAEVASWGEALREECRIKSLSRIEKERLVAAAASGLRGARSAAET